MPSFEIHLLFTLHMLSFSFLSSGNFGHITETFVAFLMVSVNL